MKIDKTTIVPAILGTVVTGFLLGVGFHVATKMFNKPQRSTDSSSSSANGYPDKSVNDGWASPAYAEALDHAVNTRVNYVSAADGQNMSPNDHGWGNKMNGATLTNFDFTTGKFR